MSSMIRFGKSSACSRSSGMRSASTADVRRKEATSPHCQHPRVGLRDLRGN